jgi:hypothetical protein
VTRESIVTELKAERDRLNAALAALEGGRRRRGRPPGRRRRLSAAARKRISQAMKKAWAGRKKSR